MKILKPLILSISLLFGLAIGNFVTLEANDGTGCLYMACNDVTNSCEETTLATQCSSTDPWPPSPCAGTVICDMADDEK